MNINYLKIIVLFSKTFQKKGKFNKPVSFDPIEPVISKNPSVVFVGSFNIIEDQLIDKIFNL